jgi:hypothetical protein
MADKIEDGGHAFPVCFEGGQNSGESPYFHEGMSLRDYFAGQALAGFLPALSHADEASLKKIAKENGFFGFVTNAQIGASVAYGYADAMLAARKEVK